MSPKAVKNRLKLVSQLWRLSISLGKAKKDTVRKRMIESTEAAKKTACQNGER